MKAISKSRRGVGLELVEVPIPEYGVNDVLIKCGQAPLVKENG